MKGLTLAIVASVMVSDVHSFRIENYYHDGWKCNYTAYCFNKEEAEKIRDAIDQGVNASIAVSLIPAAEPFATIIGGALAGLNLVVWWAAGQGKKGFSVNVPNPQNILEQGRLPFLWESEG